jgi:hypothetical protein
LQPWDIEISLERLDSASAYLAIFAPPPSQAARGRRPSPHANRLAAANQRDGLWLHLRGSLPLASG